MAGRRRVPSPVNSYSEEDQMDVNNSDGDNDYSDAMASDFNSSEETDLMDPADYREDSKNDTSDLTGLLAGDEHLSEYYVNMMTNSDRSLLQYNEYMPNSWKLLNRVEQEWFKQILHLRQAGSQGDVSADECEDAIHFLLLSAESTSQQE
ncbi:hypothetical protein BDFG_06832 [Blastomyces dermatitidis ATCC 26199]|nr:hypothetical protein BDFG_06832 [Blastomyces dermatitidis ATCC 26199]